MEKPIVLVIMDGVGKGDGGSGDAVTVAKTPTLDRLLATCPHTYIKAHGTAVGLPSDEDMGNSEVGHNALGCGQVYSQGAKLVGESIETGTLYQSATWQDLIANAKAGLPLTDIPSCVKAGMNVALGTGGAVECGNLDLFEVMRFAALNARLSGGDATGMPADAILMMGTSCGARAQGRSEETGMLKAGMDADLILVDFTAPHLMPCHDVKSGLVFSAKGGDVAMTMVRGKILYQNGNFPTIDLSSVVQELMEYAIPRLTEKE